MSDRTWQLGESLATADWLPRLVRETLADPGDRVDAFGSGPEGPAPAFASPWRDAWGRGQLELHDAGPGRESAAASLQALADGADVVVTGQQPGFLGGPLYGLLKAATAVALARERTASGHPTVPLFWCGDDDDDLAEALSVRVWDPHRGAMLRPRTPETVRGRRVGALPAGLLGAAEAAWLREMGGAKADLLVALWEQAADGGWTWGRLHAAGLVRVFAGTGLLTVSGDDPELLAAAEPFVRDLPGRAAELAALARRRGEELARAGHHAQIGERSLERPLHRADGGRRQGFEDPREARGVPAAELRCGVLLRSPLQDWLFRPAAVVVGPGERAYLEQLRPVYAALGLVRSPLVPRLHAGFGPVPKAEGDDVDESAVEAVLAEAAAALAARLGHDAEDRARRTAERWRGSVRRALRRDRPPVETARDDWRRPGGRQERVLPGLWAEALVPDLRALLDDAATAHLARWRDGDVCDLRLPVPESLEARP